jgi:DNA-binding NarL/FixJ family response regulator
MHPGDCFAIDTPPAVFANLRMSVTNRPARESAVRETVTGRMGGAVSLAIGTAQIINAGAARYAWVTPAALTFVATTTLTAGVISVRDNFYPMAAGPNPALRVQGYVKSVSTGVMMLCVVVILRPRRCVGSPPGVVDLSCTIEFVAPSLQFRSSCKIFESARNNRGLIRLDVRDRIEQDLTIPAFPEVGMSPRSIRVAIASDNRLLAVGLAQALSGHVDLIVSVYDPSDDASLARVAASHDVVLLDALASGERPRLGMFPDGGVFVFVGAPDDDAWAGAALSAGARGILTRNSTPDDVVGAIRVVHGGGIWARRRWLNDCVRHIVGDARRRLATRDVVDARLSRREREVLRHAATGISNKELATCLDISEATVKVHLTRIFQKLGISSRAALAAAYHDNGDGRSYDVQRTLTVASSRHA